MKYLHTMVRVENIDASLDFYCNKLGLKEIRRVENKMIWVLWFMLGLIWAWGIVAVVAVFVQYQDNVAYQKLDVPPIVNTVETIPVDVYKLEKVIVEY